MEPASYVVLPMQKTEIIHQPSSAIRLLISPPINLLIIEKQQLTVEGWGGGGGHRLARRTMNPAMWASVRLCSSGLHDASISVHLSGRNHSDAHFHCL